MEQNALPEFRFVTISDAPVQGDTLFCTGSRNRCVVNNSCVIGDGNSVTGNYNYVMGQSDVYARCGYSELELSNSTVEGDCNTIFGNGNLILGNNNLIYSNSCRIRGTNNRCESTTVQHAIDAIGRGNVLLLSVPHGTYIPFRLRGMALDAYNQQRVVSPVPVVAQYDTLCSGADEAISDGDDERLVCQICLERRRKCAALPCHHLAFCHTCALRLQQSKQPLCPLCNASVTRFEWFYF